MKIADAFVEIRIDRKKAESDAKSAASGALDAMRNVFAAGVVIAGLNKSVQDASNLNETISKTKVIFGDAQRSIETWSKSSAQQLGISQRAALDAASTFAILGQAAGLSGQDLATFSTDLTGLASDLASFNNTTPEAAIEAIGAALRGESEPIRQYGVLLDDATLKARAMEMGLYDGVGALEQSARVMAAQKEILAQTTQAQGDFARTADGVANKQRIANAEAENASASFGEVLIPVYDRALEVVTFLVQAFAELPAPLQTAVVGLAGLIAFSGPLGTLKDGIAGLSQAFVNAGISASTLATTIGVVGGVLAAAVVLYIAFTEKQKDTSIAAGTFAAAMERSTAEVIENAAAIRAAEGDTRSFGLAFTSLSVAIINALPDDEVGSRSQAVVRALGRLGLTSADTAGAFAQLGRTANLLNFREFLATTTGLTDEQKELIATMLASGASITDFQKAINNTDPDNGLVFTFDQMEAAAGVLTLRLNAVDVDLAAIADTFTDTARGANEFTQSLVAQAEANLRASGTVADGVPLLDEYLRIVAELPPEQQAQALSLDAVAAATEGVTIATDDAADAQTAVRDRFIEAREAAEDQRQAMRDLYEELLSQVDAQRAYERAIDDAEQAVSDLDAVLQDNKSTLEEVDDAARGAEDAAIDMARAYVESKGKTLDSKEGVDLMIESLYAQALALAPDSPLRQRLLEYIAELQSIPRNIETTVRLSGISGLTGTTAGTVDGRGFGAQERQLGVDLNGNGIVGSALGRYVPARSNLLSTFGEEGPEAILPLDKPNRLVELLSDPRIGGPVGEAFGAMGDGGGGAGGGGMAPIGAPSVRVYIGERELTDIVDVRIDRWGGEQADRITRGRSR